MSRQAESRLQLKIRRAIEQRYTGSFWYKVHGGVYQRAGLPDLIGCIHGMFFAFEVKMPGGKATAIQKATIRQMRRAGAHAYIVHSVAEALDLIAAIMRQSGRVERQTVLN